MGTEFKPSIEQQMLFRVPTARAFAAFIDPSITTKFWFSHSDGPLVEGKTVTWEWRPYRHSVAVNVVSIEPDKRIIIRWGDEIKNSIVEWNFEPRGDDATLVTVSNSDFAGFSADQLVPVAIDSMGGFSLVLANAKAYLEHGIQLNLIFDKAPDAIKN
ncbi:SRPBCC family protein [Aliiglaciecola litoralis]|uniref:SRPBCC family protein n=1 Tax=Aliiglaciecola litoralis TaxID=582857 RepID=A0ABP3WTB0_9ALTE